MGCFRAARLTGTLGVALACMAAVSMLAPRAAADDPPERIVNFRYTPTARAQIAIWIEQADGTFMQTLRLTEGVSYRGIGNRPGALQMNSGFRWPYGRREGVLPVWAHRRLSAPGSEYFPMVIFQDRTSEGFASRSSNDASRDDFFCLSFNQSTTRRDALDAVSCASVFNSDKGRYVTEADVERGYSEPFVDEAGGTSRALPIRSLYPPRRDVIRCEQPGCSDHVDVARFQEDARRVMPDIDAVSMATPVGDEPQMVQLTVPAEWPNGSYVAYIEVGVEGDYNDVFNDTTNPTPMSPSGRWDFWAISYGYPYRGQPSVVYRVPFELSAAGGDFATDVPAGYGALHGEDGELRSMDGTITDEPGVAPGSGADRLRADSEGNRFSVQVVATNVCAAPVPPPECGRECSADDPCAAGFICSAEGACVGMCDVPMSPREILSMGVAEHPDVKQAHHYAVLSFVAPTSPRPISRYEVRYGTSPIDASNFDSARDARRASIEGEMLEVPTTARPGELIELQVGGLIPQTRHFFAIRAVDVCNAPGPVAAAEVTTTEIHFTTVSPCFVATAAHGSPLAAEVGALRRLRDRHLMTSSAGRALVDLYYAVGPRAASIIRDDETLRAGARAALSPVVGLARWLDD